MIANNSEGILISLKDRIQKIASKLEEDEINDWIYTDEGCLGSAWDAWLEGLKKKIKNEQYVQKLSSGVSSATVPDIWNDAVASSEFEESFFNSVLYYIGKVSKETRNYPAYFIKEIVSDFSVCDQRTLKKNIEDYFIENKNQDIFELE